LAKRKLKHFAENLTFPHFFQPTPNELIAGFNLKGKWKSHFFHNNNPIVIELGCGKGEYTVQLAKANPNINYIGIDIKGARMWNGASTSLKEKLVNTAFLRTRIELTYLTFEENEIDEIWITFPDPQPKKSKQNKRLTSPKFLNIYSKFLKKNGIIHLKTDNIQLFEYTLEVIKNNKHKLISATYDLYSQTNLSYAQQIKTFYENMFLQQNLKICYLEFTLNNDN